MNETIRQFMEQQSCATVCCADEQGKPYCFSCFYIINCEEGLLYFKSSAGSYHSILMSKNPFLSGTILPDKLNKLVVKGIQFEAIVLDKSHPSSINSASYYHKKNPMALAIPGEIWTIQMNKIKMTDSTFGFGKKINWNREEKS